jgi:glycosyltransferase involved in cell wall biosynthesis
MNVHIQTDTTAPLHEAPLLSILAWPASSLMNRYTASLYENMQGVAVDDFKPGWRMLLHVLGKRYDVFHIHWLERAFWREGKLQIVRAVCVTLLAALIIKLRKGAIIWTAHDPIPHETKFNNFTHRGSFSLLWKAYTALLTKMLNGIVLLSATHRQIVISKWLHLEKVPFAVTPHPHFKGVYPNAISRDDARERLGLPADKMVLLLLGVIRPYKNAEALIEAFRDRPDDNLRLVVAGKPDTDDYANTLKILAHGDPRIVFHFAFVADNDLQIFLNAADAVVIPFKKATNSGSVALALSFARPVAVSDLPVFREVQDIVGESWMRLMPDGLSPGELTNIVGWVGQERSKEPDLDLLDWPSIAAQTASFFRSVLQRGIRP